LRDSNDTKKNSHNGEVKFVISEPVNKNENNQEEQHENDEKLLTNDKKDDKNISFALQRRHTLGGNDNKLNPKKKTSSIRKKKTPSPISHSNKESKVRYGSTKISNRDDIENYKSLSAPIDVPNDLRISSTNKSRPVSSLEDFVKPQEFIKTRDRSNTTSPKRRPSILELFGGEDSDDQEEVSTNSIKLAQTSISIEDIKIELNRAFNQLGIEAITCDDLYECSMKIDDSDVRFDIEIYDLALRTSVKGIKLKIIEGTSKEHFSHIYRKLNKTISIK